MQSKQHQAQAHIQATANFAIQTGVAVPPVINKGNAGSGWVQWARAMATCLQPNQCIQIPLGANTSPYASQPACHQTRQHVAAYLRKALLANGKTCTTRTTYIGTPCPANQTVTVWCTG